MIAVREVCLSLSCSLRNEKVKWLLRDSRMSFLLNVFALPSLVFSTQWDCLFASIRISRDSSYIFSIQSEDFKIVRKFWVLWENEYAMWYNIKTWNNLSCSINFGIFIAALMNYEERWFLIRPLYEITRPYKNYLYINLLSSYSRSYRRLMYSKLHKPRDKDTSAYRKLKKKVSNFHSNRRSTSYPLIFSFCIYIYISRALKLGDL